MIEAATVRRGSASRWSLTALLLAWTAAWADGDPGVMRRAADLRATPSDSAQSVLALPAQAPVTRLAGREGSWIQVRTANGQTGWVPPPSASVA